MPSVKAGSAQRSRHSHPFFDPHPTGTAAGAVRSSIIVNSPASPDVLLLVSRCVEPLTEDAAVVQLAQRGDSAAFERLYAVYARLVHGILISRVPAGDAEDLLQDVFMQAMEKLQTLRDPAAFGAWIAAIARHRAVDHLRRRPHTTTLPDDLAATESGEARAFEVLAAIRTLPDAYRETLILRLVEGLTGPEIAACTGLTPASVRVNLHRGMKQLRERLGTLERNAPGA